MLEGKIEVLKQTTGEYYIETTYIDENGDRAVIGIPIKSEKKKRG